MESNNQPSTINGQQAQFGNRLSKLREDVLTALSRIEHISALETLEKRYFGRHGSFTILLKSIQQLPGAERPKAGATVNTIKRELHQAFQTRRTELSGSANAVDDEFTLSLPGVPQTTGTVHPLMSMQDKIVDIFRTMGYEVLYGPEIELAKYNFDLLRIPENHPARDVWDTFYIEADRSLDSARDVASKKNNEKKIRNDAPTSGPDVPLLRTHISPMQLRVMETRKPPIRFISPGRVFRHEATDATHEANYFYCEGVAIDKGLTFGHLLGTLEAFFKVLFGPKAKIRAQPSYFPFVEPGAEILMQGEHGWMEMLGCGMIHPEVLHNMRVNPKEYSGFAFGIGIDRVMMYYHNIPDVRMSYQGDLRFLQQFPL